MRNVFAFEHLKASAAGSEISKIFNFLLLVIRFSDSLLVERPVVPQRNLVLMNTDSSETASAI